MNIKEIRELTSEELNKKLKEQKAELFNLRFQHAINQLDNPAKIAEAKREIARILTVIRENEIAGKQ